MEQEIKKLREATGWNIIVLFWLGIIDLETYVFQLLEPKFESIKNPFRWKRIRKETMEAILMTIKTTRMKGREITLTSRQITIKL